MGDLGNGIYLSPASERGWRPDADIGGQADLILQDPSTTVGLWRSGPGPVSSSAPVRIPARESIYVIAGSVRIAVDDSESFDLGPGDVISIPPQAMVGWDPSADCEVFWVYS